MIPNVTKIGLGSLPYSKFSSLFKGLFLIALFSFPILQSSAQETESAPGIITVCPYGDFDGHHHTPAADWILEKLESPSQSLIGDDPCSTIEVTYNDFPPAAEAAFQAAVDIWETVLSSPIIIRVEANWTVLEENTLGSAGPANLYRNFANAPTTDFYAAALADQISGVDQNPGGFDITANFNSNFDWYFGTDGNTPFNQVDLVSIVLHELGHGLGFVSSKQYIGGLGFLEIGTSGFPLNYDNFLTLGAFGTPLLDLSGIPLGNAMTSNNVYNNSPLAVAALGGVAPRIYAPVAYASGSTLSHWDESTFPSGNINSLMTPSLGFGEAIHNPGDITIGLFEDMGWTICYAADYCPDLEASIGDPCDDGNPSTTGDIVTEECECVGISSITNDAICAASPINCGAVVEGTTVGATESALGYACLSYSYPDVFYTFTGYPGTEYTVTVNGDNYDGMLNVYSGTCDGALTSLGCADNGFFPGIEETITFSVSTTETIYIQTSGYVTPAAFTLELSCSSPNDTPCGASPINADGSLFLSSNVAASVDEGEVIPPAGSAGCTSQDGWCSFELTLASSVWFSVVAPPSGSISVSTCNDGTSFDTQLALYSATDCSDYSTFSLIGANDDLTGCAQTYASSLTACVNPGETYYIQVDGYSSQRGGIAISVTEEDGSECPGQDCLNTIPYISASLNQTNILQTITTCVYEEEYITLNNALNGNEYVFTSSGASGGYMTVRSGTFDGPVLGAGFSPLTVVSDIDGNLFIHYTVNENCETASGICVIATAQCTSCPPPFDCPSLEANIGDPCDDGNPETENDLVTADCECIGTPTCTNPELTFYQYADGGDILQPFEECINLGTPYNIAVIITGDFGNTSYNLSVNGELVGEFTPNGSSPVGVGPISDPVVDITITGVQFSACSTTFTSSVEICPFDCPDLGLYFGDACDDGNPNTFDDIVGDNCVCAGTPVNDDCADALSIVCGETASGSTLGATADATLPLCGIFLTTAPGVWYSLTGYSGLISVTTCSEDGPEYDTVLGVFSGSCEALVCIDGNDDGDVPDLDCTIGDATFIRASFVEFEASADETYLIYVTGFSANVGNFDLTVSCEPIFDCPALEANIGDPCDDGNPETENDLVTPDCNCVGTSIYDCPDLSANIGDACDDGNPSTENDLVTADCACAGTVPAPANDLCANAQNLDINLPGDCAGNETIGTTSGATSAGLAIGCEAANPEVFYSFNSGEHSSIQFNFESITVTDLVLTLLEGGCDGVITECGFATSNIYGVTPFTDYTVRISTNTGIGNTGTFSICLEGIFDCPLLSANISDACDDGNPETENDVVTADCNCEGTIVYDCPSLSANIGDACDDGNAGTENDVITAECECVGTVIYDCPVLEANIGDACDDDNPLTVNDVIQTDCSCIGVPVNDNCSDAISLVVNQPEECAGNETLGTTTGATASNPDACESSSPDVYYSFNSGFYSEVIINLAPVDATDLVLSVFEGSCGSAAFICSINPVEQTLIGVDPSTTYYVRIHSLDASFTGTFNICIEGVAPDFATLNGSINGWNSNCLERDAEVSLSELTLGYFYSTIVTLNPDGTFELSGLDILPGTYDILVKADGALAKLTEDVVINAGSNSFASGSVILGDLNGNNVVNIADYSVMNAAFGSANGDANFNFIADLNCNSVVNITDLSILGAAFGLAGDAIIIVD